MGDLQYLYAPDEKLTSEIIGITSKNYYFMRYESV